MNLVNKCIKICQKRAPQFSLGIVLVLLVFYLLCSRFREYLSVHSIDPNFIIGFLTVTALLLSITQASRDKRYAYNLQLIKSIEDKGLFVIAKLISIKNKSLIYLGTIQAIKSILGTDKVYRDTNETLSKSDLEKDMEMVATYIDTFFPELKEVWNDLIGKKLTELGTICANVTLNYNENQALIGTDGFRNHALDNIDSLLKSAEALNQEIEQITLKMRDTIVEKINTSTGKFKETIDFKF